jgi:protein-S-isoprenylcysteine O-methyltransferase Ste14
MLARAITAFVVLPGLTAFIIPVIIGWSSGQPTRHVALAITLILIGALILVWCVREFYVAGRGTLAPWARPRRLVTTGPYRLSRNPMYLCVTIVLAGWCALWDSPALNLYAVVTLCVLFTRVLLLEERWVARQFASEWEAYRARTPRWLPRLPSLRVLTQSARGRVGR